MNKRIATVLIALLPLFLFVAVSSAATTATVTATVTFQNISVSVSDGTIAYGTMGASATKSTIAADLNDTQTATNNGNIAEDINIKGQNTAAWTLAGSAGADQYMHQFCISTCGSPPTNFSALTTNYQTLAAGVAASGTQTFELRLTTPSSSTSFVQQSVDVTVQAAAP